MSSVQLAAVKTNSANRYFRFFMFFDVYDLTCPYRAGIEVLMRLREVAQSAFLVPQGTGVTWS